MAPYYVLDTPGQRRLAAALKAPLGNLAQRSFTQAHSIVIAELAFAVIDVFDQGDHADARILAEALLAALDWQPPTGTTAADHLTVYGPDHRGTHYALIRTEYPPSGDITHRKDRA